MTVCHWVSSSNILKDHGAFLFRDKQPTLCGLLHYDTLKHQELLAQKTSVGSVLTEYRLPTLPAQY